MYNPYKNHMFLHGTYIQPSEKTKNHDAIIACVKDLATGEPKLHIIEDPKVECWVSKPAFRNFVEKKEYASIKEVDTYLCEYRDQYSVIAKALNISTNQPYLLRRKVLESPYIWGADIEPLLRLKLEYQTTTTEITNDFNIGSLDIEVDVTGSNEVNVMSYCDYKTRKVYCGVLKHWLKGKSIDDLTTAKIDKFKEYVKGLKPEVRAIWDTQPFDVEFNIVDDEKACIIWTLRKLVLCKPEFCGVWNIAFDIPHLIGRCVFRNINLVQLMKHPDVPDQYATFEWKEDHTAVDHFTDVWHQVIYTGYTRFYDPMCLYSRLRKVKGRELFYTLDFIGQKILGSGKANMGHATHADAQANAFVEYSIYNVIDTIVPTLLAAFTQDVVSWLLLSSSSLLADFAKQTVQLKAQFYAYCRSKGLVPGTAFGSMETPTDRYIGNVGGAVLSPSRMRTKGVKCLEESNEETFVYQLVSDLDVKSFYPSITNAFNISRETKIATILWAPFCPYSLAEIEEEYATVKDSRRRVKVKANAEAIVAFMGRYITSKENAVALCKEYFSIPGYQEFQALWERHCSESNNSTIPTTTN